MPNFTYQAKTRKSAVKHFPAKGGCVRRSTVSECTGFVGACGQLWPRRGAHRVFNSGVCCLMELRRAPRGHNTPSSCVSPPSQEGDCGGQARARVVAVEQATRAQPECRYTPGSCVSPSQLL
jgi:hypothetical protein